jgi:peptidoglycan/xylan/chitin deacetylase (PgdA/CDA1 family)
MRFAHVLTYHSGNIAGNDYATNDLVAFREDLRIIERLGLSIIPLRTLVDALIGPGSNRLPEHVVSITFDDGLDFDFIELAHPLHGVQPSVAGIMREFVHEFALPVHATSFVIASPEARMQIANKEMLGHQWISDSWWREAVASGLFHIANHSWDHVSPSVGYDTAEADRRASSRFIDNPVAAALQVRRAREYIERIAPNPGSALLAYPYGDYSAFLVGDYLPDARRGHGTVAAFTGEPGVVTPASNRWTLPRNSCGKEWQSPEGLAALLGG